MIFYRHFFKIFLTLFILIVFFYLLDTTHQPVLNSENTPMILSNTPQQLGEVKKDRNCQEINGMPDRLCTPGAIDSHVTQDNIQQTICQSGYTKTVRPETSYTNKLKKIIMSQYNDTGDPSNYELDHLVSLELGGNPTEAANLWPEPYNSTMGARQKDVVENYLHDQVCANKMNLFDAQETIATDWESVYVLIKK